MSNFVNLMDIVYPIGSIYQSMSVTSPASTIGGTWTKINTFLYGADTVGQTGGEKMHTLTIMEMPTHAHAQYVTANSGGPAVRCDYSSDVQGLLYPQGINTGNSGGGKHTTTSRPTQLVSSGIAQHNCVKSKRFKFKRGGVCLITLISWILSTPLGRYLFQTVASHQQVQSVEHGRNSIVTRLSAAARQIRLAAQTQLDLQLMKCRHTIIDLLDLANGSVVVRKIILKSLLMVREIGIHRWIQWKTLVAISRLTTAPSIGLLTSISAQPSYMLGGVA